MLPRHGWSVEATECHQHLDDKVGHQTFEEVEVALQGHLYSFAFFLCDAQRFMSTCLVCSAHHHVAKQWLLDVHCAGTTCSASSFPSVASLVHVVVEEAGVVGQAWLLTG